MYIARQCFDIVDLIGRALKTCASYPESFFSIMDLGRKPRMNQLNPYSIFTWKNSHSNGDSGGPIAGFYFCYRHIGLQCFDTVGSVAGRASGL